MSDLRIGRGWTDAELARHLDALPALKRNFDDEPDSMNRSGEWHRYWSEAVIGTAPPGPPQEEGPFARARTAVVNYEFSDPRIVIAHFNPDVPLLGRRLLLEMRALRVLHYLGGVVIGAVRSEEEANRSVFGFRYDTLEGHIEQGVEWFLLTKDHETGHIRFRISACWRHGEFPNWWSRAGFRIVGKHYQEKWHRQAHRTMAAIARRPVLDPPEAAHRPVVHSHPEVIFRRIRAEHLP